MARIRVEIAAVLRAARAATKAHVIAIVQPHRYTRLHSLFDGFAGAFNHLDTVIVTDDYPPGKSPIAGADRDSLSHRALKARAHRHALGLRRPEDLPALIRSLAKPGNTLSSLARAISPNGHRAAGPARGENSMPYPSVTKNARNPS